MGNDNSRAADCSSRQSHQPGGSHDKAIQRILKQAKDLTQRRKDAKAQEKSKKWIDPKTLNFVFPLHPSDFAALR